MSVKINGPEACVSKFGPICCPWWITHDEEAISKYLSAAGFVNRTAVLVYCIINSTSDKSSVNQYCGSRDIFGPTLMLPAPTRAETESQAKNCY
jgi:hypothetical protein